MKEKEFIYAYNMVRGNRMKGLTVQEAAIELGVSTRTVFRMLQDGRLKGEKWGLPYGRDRFYWIIDPTSVARIQIRKEMELEQKTKKGIKQAEKSDSESANKTPK